jgi:hypothetical protein
MTNAEWHVIFDLRFANFDWGNHDGRGVEIEIKVNGIEGHSACPITAEERDDRRLGKAINTVGYLSCSKLSVRVQGLVEIGLFEQAWYCGRRSR